MGTLALVKPTTFQKYVNKVLGAFTVGQQNFNPVIENAGDPTGAVTPDFIGQVCVDTTNTHSYIAQSAVAAGWARIDN